MSLKTELIEAMANEVLKKLKSEDSLWSYCSKTGKIRSVDLDGTFDVKSLLACALSAHSAFLSERGLKVVGREVDDGMIEAASEVSEGERSGLTAFGSDYWEAMLAAAPDLFAETPDVEG